MNNAIPEGLNLDGYNKETGRPEFLVTGQQDVISQILGISPTAKFWSLLWEWRSGLDGTLRDLAECSGISRTSLYKILPDFIDNEWVIPSRYVRGVQYYRLNEKNHFVKKMMELLTLFVLTHTEIAMAKEEAMDNVAKSFRKKEVKKSRRA